ncbi:uncharacterized protein IL334_003339 [Kwoniella shivajii]|uniref:Major facilitator superfamily (MFS) profile domain-containing protein n=1 Tax=Kwoniella shivajii TaxID=564305 RepID=A0ABZ1CXB0_9TREE|nr:hypothetical protein IL334_003339 [Kwoniella shivajii]
MIESSSDNSLTASPTISTPAEQTIKPNGDVEKGADSKSPAPPTMPEGGLQAWLCVLGAWLTMFATFGYANSFGVFQAYYIVKYPNVTASDISWVGSVQLFLQFALGAFTGPLYDKGYFYHLMYSGAVLYIVCIFMTSLCKEFWQTVLAQALGLGIGIGLMLLPAFSVLSHYFMKKRAIAMGIAVTGSSTGAICLPIMLNNLFKSHGFEKAVQYTGYLLLGCLILACALLRTRLPVKKGGPPKPTPKELFSSVPYTLVVAGLFCVTWGQFFPVYYIQIYGEDHGISSNLTQYTIAILNAASIFGRTLPNFFADKVGSLNVITLCSFFTGVLVFAIFGAGSPGGLIVVAILYGFFSGAYVSLMTPAAMTFAKGFNELGSRVGWGMLVMSLAALSGSPIQGALLDRYGFYAPTIWSGVCVLMGSALLAVATRMHARDKRTWKV